MKTIHSGLCSLYMHYLIIGASSGIGNALYEHLRAEGHEVIATYDQNHIDGGHHFNAIESNDFSFIPEELDGMVYCPGAINLKPFKSLKAEHFIEDYHLQVIGAVKVIQAAQKALLKSKNASIVLFSTVAVQSGFPYHSLVSSSKGAVEGLTRALAAEFAPKIRVNAIAPSLTNTPLAAKLLSSEEKIQANAERHPLKRVGEPADIAEMAAFLLSEKASWMSGQVLKVDGGMSSLKI